MSEPAQPSVDLPSTVIPAIGEPIIRQLVHAFYQRVRHDVLVGGMYPPDEWEAAETRLADFLVYRLGGAQDYLTRRGAPRLRMRHASFAITPAARNRWMELMTEALAEVPLPQPYVNIVTQFLSETATFLINRPQSR
ncbi:hemin transporter [Planctopirus hydrillae]|uniref:Hemin transporter n=1 Tax=Planctopirus hydrillae TaxID=1841610 RepID=A0A1C3EI34_9PLAN|nr:hemin transporter [Planctopirus hydrillae]ODA32887.1 hemin transporter [Planctopirus hydrillae]